MTKLYALTAIERAKEHGDGANLLPGDVFTDTEAATARYLALKAGRPNFADAMRVVVGVRPGAKARGGLKRPYARIISTITPEQHAADNRTAKLSRTQILRRAGS